MLRRARASRPRWTASTSCRRRRSAAARARSRRRRSRRAGRSASDADGALGPRSPPADRIRSGPRAFLPSRGRTRTSRGARPRGCARAASRARPRRGSDRGRCAGALRDAPARSRVELRARDSLAQLEQLDDGGLTPGAHVVDAAVVRPRGHGRAGDVADVDVVARLRAVAEDLRRLAGEQPLEEDRDDARLAVRVLPRAVHVPVPQRRRARPVEPVVRRRGTPPPRASTSRTARSAGAANPRAPAARTRRRWRRRSS